MFVATRMWPLLMLDTNDRKRIAFTMEVLYVHVMRQW